MTDTAPDPAPADTLQSSLGTDTEVETYRQVGGVGGNEYLINVDRSSDPATWTVQGPAVAFASQLFQAIGEERDLGSARWPTAPAAAQALRDIRGLVDKFRDDVFALIPG